MTYTKDNIKLLLADCMDVMADYPDNYFDLAVVDPPYGIGEDGGTNHTRGKLATAKSFAPKGWDVAPPGASYFAELMRVSKNQIVWGANHFISRLPFDSSCWIVWDKQNGATDFADCELAWTSFNTAVRKFSFRWQGMLQGTMANKETRIHPTQKPVALYDWIFTNYAEPGQRIIDTHLGSTSSAIAADRHDFAEFVGVEIDAEYYHDGVKRFRRETAQMALAI